MTQINISKNSWAYAHCTSKTMRQIMHLRLRVFKYTLAGETRTWLHNLPQNSIRSWGELVHVFLGKWIPPSKRAELQDNFFQGEQLHEAWVRFKQYLVRSQNHGFLKNILFEKFYKVLDPMNQFVANSAAANGSFMDNICGNHPNP